MFDSYFEEVQRRWKREWPAIAAARQRTSEALERLAVLAEYDTKTTSIVVFGSLGRGEVTSSSDADWTLLFDGPADVNPFLHMPSIAARFKDLGFKEPGTTGTFGHLASSHDLIHYIAGTKDTNDNLTRRMLLLAESRSITNPTLRETVIRHVLSRYVIYDRRAPSPNPSRPVVPYFLINDVVRYWRTITTDYAAKVWERDAKGWATRNTKLRFSRKLIFVWGLLTCFSFELFSPENHERLRDDRERLPHVLADHILAQTAVRPLDQLCRLILQKDDEAAARMTLDSYNRFLSALDDAPSRDRLEALSFEDAADDELYVELRSASRRFQEGITRLFYDGGQVESLLKQFGVF